MPIALSSWLLLHVQLSSSPCRPNPHLYKLLQLPAPAQHLHSKLLGGFQWNCYVEEDKLRLKLSSVTAGLHLLTMDNTCTRNVGYYGTPKKICQVIKIERTSICHLPTLYHCTGLTLIVYHYKRFWMDLLYGSDRLFLKFCISSGSYSCTEH